MMQSRQPAFIDLTGKRFGMLTVLNAGARVRLPSGQTQLLWLCACDCGTQREVRGIHLRHGHTKSCGCLQPAVTALRSVTHGLSKSSEYHTWYCMLGRCGSANHPDFRLYGGRGITVCDRWRDDFAAFYSDMGPKPSPRHSIDRIDSNGHYEPNNCRWALPLDQARNTSRNVYVDLDGKRVCAAEAADRLGIKRSTLYARLARGVDPREALNITRESR